MIESVSTEPGEAPGGAGAIFVNIFAAPREAFAALASRPTFLLPLLAVVLANCALVLWYYSEVDIGWLLQTTLEASGQDVPPELLNENSSAMGGASRVIIGGVAVLSSAVFIVLLTVLMAGYLSAVSLFTNDGFTFRHWLSLVAWSSLPKLLSVLSSAVNLAVNEIALMPPTEINLLSLANLLGTQPAGGGMLSTLLQGTDVTSIWALGLIVLGYSLWSRRPIVTSFAIAAAPALVLFGLALLLAAL